MGKAAGETTSSSSACGGPSNPRRSICGATPMSRSPGLPSADISTAFTIPEGPIRALTGGRRMRPTSLRCSQPRLQHNHGRNLLSRSQPAVQTNRASSLDLASTDRNLLNVLHDEVPISYIYFRFVAPLALWFDCVELHVHELFFVE